MSAPRTPSVSAAARRDDRARDESGAALIAVVLVLAILSFLGSALLFQTSNEQAVAINEQDYLKALGFAEAGRAWAERRVLDTTGGFTGLLVGPDSNDASDDTLIGLRDLSLGATSQFTLANEDTASAIVTRDFFGEGSASYEALRLEDGPGTRALVYVRLQDNYDDSPDDPAGNDPLADTDNRVRVVVVAEYPIFVDASGVEVANALRGPARRSVVAGFSGGESPPGILVGGDVKMEGDFSLCGGCGSFHTNGNLTIKDHPVVCGSATASGTWDESNEPTYGGANGGGFPTKSIPVVNPYDTRYVPSVDVFDTTSLSLPSELQCGPPTVSDPGNSKYFAFVANGDKGLVFKAYRDFVNDRWMWRMIDDLDDEVDVSLDDCGRMPDDPNFDTAVVDEKDDEFYGWKQEKSEATESCDPCSGTSDDTLCTLANNDFGVNGYYDATTGSLVGSVSGSSIPAFPGSDAPDGILDLDPDVRHKDSLWKTKNDNIYSPLYNAVIFFYANAQLNNKTGHPDKEYCSSSGCGTVPGSGWMVSLIAYGDLENGNEPYLRPANGPGGFSHQIVAGRDVKIGNRLNELAGACSGACTTGAPSDIALAAGLIAAHEQAEINNDKIQFFGRIVIEDGAGCSDLVDIDGGRTSKVAKLNQFYDCYHPSAAESSGASMTSWQELD